MSEAAVGYERREITLSDADRARGRESDVWALLRGHRVWRNTAVAIVALAAAANVGLLVISSGW